MMAKAEPCTRTVLIVEDQADVADSLALYLNLAGGFKTVVARDGEAGVEAALREQPHAVVCDLGLPKKSGLAVAEELSRLPDKPLLIALTAYSDEATRTMARRAGFEYFLVKPTSPEVIEGLLLSHCREELLSREVGSRA
jgi:DNA-binding response OmpR family regulator